jgi:hypothetical protein
MLCPWTSAPATAQPAGGQRFPANANALLTVEVAKVLQSPLARKLDWQSKLIKGHADRPVALPATATRVTFVAGLHPGGMRSIWQAALVELPSPPRLDPILRKHGGYLDQIGGKNVAWTPKDVFYVELDQKTLGVMSPGQRQYMVRWVGGKSGNELPAYLKAAQSEAQKSDAVFALDLKDFVSLTTIRYAYDLGALSSLEGLPDDGTKLMTALASVKGAKITMHIRDGITGEIVVDFDQDVSALGDRANNFVADVLKWADLYEPTVEAWQFKANGTKIVGEGAMEPDVLNRLLALLSPSSDLDHASDAPPAPDASAGGPAPTPQADVAAPKQAVPDDHPAAASQRYYKTVSGILDGLAPKASGMQSATWLISKARVIEQLPILGVDPALLDWGNMVAEALNRAAQELAVGSQKASVSALTVQSPTAYTSYDSYGRGSSDTAENRAAYRNAQQQRRQVAQAERGAAGERAFGILNQLLPTRGKIRQDMVTKYGVEF